MQQEARLLRAHDKTYRGVAQLVARLLWEQDAAGSSPVTSTKISGFDRKIKAVRGILAAFYLSSRSSTMEKITYFDVEYANSKNKAICQLGIVCENYNDHEPLS